MRETRRGLSPAAWMIVTAILAGGALLFKLHIALTTYGTNDVIYWQRFLSLIKTVGGIGTYHAIWYFNHPPFMIHVLRIMDKLASLTGIFFPFWLRAPAILCDAGSLLLVHRVLQARLGSCYSRPALALMAVAPVSIMVSGFHGNTDPAMIFFLLLSIYLIDRCPRVAWAGVALGMSMNIKIVPLIFMPVFLFYLPSWRKRTEYFAAAGLVLCLSWMPYLILDPHIIWTRVLGYGGISGQWGLSGLLLALPPPLDRIRLGFLSVGKYVLLALIFLMAFRLNRRSPKPPLFLQCGLVAFAFIVLTPAFGVQYLAWLVPWVVALGAGPAAVYYAASGVFLFLVYNHWSQSFPWYLADSDRITDMPFYVMRVELLCWAIVVALFVLFLHALFIAGRAAEAEPAGRAACPPGGGKAGDCA